jgi:hypothetical protein
MLRLDEADESPAVMDRNSGKGFRMPPEDLFDEFL